MKAKLIKKITGIYKVEYNGKLLASTDNDMNKDLEIAKLSLKNCQAIERGYDLDVLARQEAEKLYNKSEHEDYSVWEYLVSGEVESIKLGFQKCLELMGNKKFSEEDVMLGWDAGVMSQSICFTNYFGLKRESELKSHRESYQGNLKPSALQQTEWDVEIEIQRVKDETKIVGAVKGVKGSGNKITTYKSVPKLDADGCLILKRI